MKNLLKQLLDLLMLLAIVVLLFTAGRVIFYFSTSDAFSAFTSQEIIISLFKGMEYDLWVTILINIPFIFLFLWPSRIYNSTFYIIFIKILFFLLNSAALLVNLLDVRVFNLHQHRLKGYEATAELKSFYNELVTDSLGDLASRYLSLCIYFIVFFIILWLSLRMIKERAFEEKQQRVSRRLSSVLITLVFAGLFVYSSFYSKSWLTKLYLKADRKLAPLVMNNPYLILKTLHQEENKINKDWVQEDFKSSKRYFDLGVGGFQKIRLILILSSDISEGTNKTNSEKYSYHLATLKPEISSVYKTLDELLLSFPGMYELGLCQSDYSLYNFESLPELLQKNGYSTSISSEGFDEEVVKLIKNFYGFNDNSSKTNEKIFELVLVNADKLNEINFQSIEGDENLLTITVFTDNKEDAQPKQEIIQSITFSSSKSLPLFKQQDLVITQFIDFKPTILHLLGYNEPFVTYGSSLFEKEEKVILSVGKDNTFKLLKDSLLLINKDNETTKICKFKQKSFSSMDFKDSLAVERIILENKLHSILYDFNTKLKGNLLKSDQINVVK